MGLWFVIEWDVFWDKGEECDKVVRKMTKKWKQILPDLQFRYFKKRLQGSGKEVLVITGLDNVTEIDPLLAEIRKDEDFNKIVEEWHSCIGNSNQPSYWQEKFTIE